MARMTNFARTRARAAVALLIVCAAAGTRAESGVEAGRRLAFAADKGNCLGCHEIAGGRQMGDIGPPLAGMKARFPVRAELEARIHDATDFNQESLMPPFGRHRILTAREIDLIIEFLYSL